MMFSTQLFVAYGNVARPPLIAEFEHVIWGAIFNVYLGATAESQVDDLETAWNSHFRLRVENAGSSLAHWFVDRK